MNETCWLPRLAWLLIFPALLLAGCTSQPPESTKTQNRRPAPTATADRSDDPDEPKSVGTTEEPAEAGTDLKNSAPSPETVAKPAPDTATSVEPEAKPARTAAKDVPDPEKAPPAVPSPTKQSTDEPGSKTAKKPAVHKREKPNRLAGETSPYLLLHAYNPVDWYPWGPEALAKARKEGKMIFLSIGYSSCYWCHVMERESFSDAEIAKFMNENFVNIKVDREERPDIDDIYMTALQSFVRRSGGGGTGWPLSMFLTPATQPVVGGTYFPPRDVEGRPPGFLGVLKQVHELWSTRRKDAQRNAEILTRDVQVAMRPRLVLASDSLDASLVTTSVEGLVESHDSTFGGIGFTAERPDGPKFPTPPKLELLQWAAVVAGKTSPPAKVLDHTLIQIANGGIHDQIGGGFHRYSTDRKWRVPHFEKMLYDNAQLADLYVAAFARTGDTTFREVAEGVFTYVLRDMTDPDGPFYSAQDAETDAIEGKYYVWSAKEIDQSLGDQSTLFRQRFGVVNKPDFEHGNVLFRAMPLEKVVKSAQERQALSEMKSQLLAIRKKREAPLRDDKVLTSWNGLMIRSLANGGRVLKRPDYIQAATRAADFLLVHLRDKDQTHLLRTYRKGKSKLNGYLVDYAFLVEGLLALHTATGDKRWLTAARTLTDEQIKLFWDEKRGGFYFTSHDHEELLARTQNGFDSVLPSGNSTSVRNLVQLAKRTGQATYRDHARKTLSAFAPQMRQHLQRGGLGMTHMALALSEFLVDEPKPAAKPKSDKPKSDKPKSDKPDTPPAPKEKTSR